MAESKSSKGSTMGGLVAAGPIPAGTIVAFYRLIPSAIDDTRAELLWNKIKRGEYNHILKLFGNVPRRKPEWNLRIKLLKKITTQIHAEYEPYTIDPFVPDVSYGEHNKKNELVFGLEPATFYRGDGTEYTAIYPPLNGIFANEPFVGSEANCEAIFPVELTHLTEIEKVTHSEAAVLARPLLYLRSTRHIKKNEEITWCYGGKYTRDYTTSCTNEPDAGADETSPIPESVMDAILVLLLLDVTGRLGFLKTMKIPSPAKLLEYHKLTSEKMSSLSIPTIVPVDAPTTSTINIRFGPELG